MKKFLTVTVIIIALVIGINYLLYFTSFFIDFNPDTPVSTLFNTDNESIYLLVNGKYERFEIKGVNIGNTIPGKFGSDYAITKYDYLRWFKQIKEMGANTIRVYQIMNADFYNALYQFNKGNDDPLYLLHGLTISDYAQNSHIDAMDEDFYREIIRQTYILVDIIHGNRQLILNQASGYGFYLRDVSPWVLGYILGSNWNSNTIAYTNKLHDTHEGYSGKYMYTTEDATAFESVLAMIGDTIIDYESARYKEQRLVSFFNWPSTDPFKYPDYITEFFKKCAEVDVENIKTTDAFVSGHFASYHAYPYYPGYLNYYENKEFWFKDEEGNVNTYTAYLKMLKLHHSIPVVITEFGVPTARGMAHEDTNKGYNQGRNSEYEQGQIIIDTYEQIQSVNCAGSLLYVWQDDWTQTTWNTQHAIDEKRSIYWSDTQSSDQGFGLLAFDPGNEEVLCHVDGNISEWDNVIPVAVNGDMSLYMQYDEKYIYYLVCKKDYDEESDVLYIPIDTAGKSGSNYSIEHDVRFDSYADFLIVLNGKNETRVLVQERYDVLRAMYNQYIKGENPYSYPPHKNSPVFNQIRLILQLESVEKINNPELMAETYETGILTHGNSNPEDAEYNSLADFNISEDCIELRIPWSLLNFSDPSKMVIHDDYYENYGVEYINIHKMYVGIGSKDNKGNIIKTYPFELRGWDKVTYHERLKQSYYMIQQVWTNEEMTADNE
ncbi:MAG TPA: hypothetical protein PK870_06055 [Clostridia bacterium]|nr:hypothetical protein [Clostridia bacterium]